MSESRHFKLRFQIYYVLKSTAWITPIFFLFLANQAHLSVSNILKISGSLMVVPLLLDTPLGILADRFGAKKLLIAGTLFQLISLLSFFILKAPINYMLYLLSIIVAENCYSGAEQSFLKENIKDNNELREFLKVTNQYFYYLTIPALIGGILLYKINAYLPLIAQSISFFAAFLSIASFPISQKIAFTEDESLSLKENIFEVLTSKRALGYVLIGIVFSGLVQINAKTIQGQIETIAGPNLAFWLGLSYIISNIASGSSLHAWRNTFLNKLAPPFQFALLFGCLFLTQISTALTEAFWVCLGFILLSSIKSIFRPILSGELISLFKCDKNLATRLSVVSTITTLGIATLHILNSNFILLDLGNLPLTLCLAALFIIAYRLVRGPKWEIHEDAACASGKKTFIGQWQQQKCLRQVYPDFAALPDISQIKQIWPTMPMPRLLFSTAQELYWEYIVGESLSSHSHQISHIYEVLSHFSNHPLEVEYTDLNGHLFLENLTEGRLKHTLMQKRFITMTHGDLTPQNILTNNDNKLVIIDWDLFGPGYSWYDVLNLVVHPDVKISRNERLLILQKYLHDIPRDLHQELMTAFSQFKALSLQHIESSVFRDLAQRYQSL